MSEALPPIDIQAVRSLAAAGGQLCTDGATGIVVSTSWLAQVAAELEAGRTAQASLDRIDAHIGETFGLKEFRL